MNVFCTVVGIKTSTAHIIFRGFSLLLLVLAVPRLVRAQETTNQQAKATQSVGASASTSNAPVIRSHVRQVLFDVVVTDFRDRPVSGLRQADFSVYEDGKTQQILSFEEHASKPNVDVRPSPELPPNTILSAPTPVDSLPLNIILLDLLNNPVEAQAAGRNELIKLLQKKPPGMRLALFVLRDRLYLIQGFTDGEAELLAAMHTNAADLYLSSFLGPNPDNLTPAEVLSSRGVTNVSGGGTQSFIAGLNNLELLEQNLYLSRRIEMTVEAFAQISHFVSGTPGRKNLVWLSAAFPIVISPGGSLPGRQNGTATLDPLAENYSPRLKEASDRLTLSQVAVYPVDIRGLSTDSPLDAANAHSFEHHGEFSQALYNAQVTRGSELQIMDEIAQNTGGHSFYNTNGLEHAMETALDDGSTYYSISYAPTNTKFDGSLRHIRVALEAKGFRQLSYRRSYFADNPDTVREQAEKTPFGRLDASMQRGAPCAHEISFTAHMASEGFPEQVNREQIRQLSYFAAFAGNKRWHGVKVQRFKIEYSVFGDQLQPIAGSDGARHATLDFVAAAYDAEGRAMSGQMSSVQEKLTPNRLRDISTKGYQIRQHLDVPTTAAWLRVCVRDSVDDRAGCVESPLHQSAGPTTMSVPSPH